MRRFAILFGVALVGFAVLPNVVQAQVVVQIGQPYAPPPVVVTQSAYYPAPRYYVAPSIRTYSPSYSPSYSYYPPAPVYSYSVPAPVYSYSAPPPVVTYSAPATVFVPAPRIVETRTYYGLGIFRPRGVYTETRVYP